jgi:hypothetical protein
MGLSLNLREGDAYQNVIDPADHLPHPLQLPPAMLVGQAQHQVAPPPQPGVSGGLPSTCNNMPGNCLPQARPWVLANRKGRAMITEVGECYAIVS